MKGARRVRVRSERCSPRCVPAEPGRPERGVPGTSRGSGPCQACQALLPWPPVGPLSRAPAADSIGPAHGCAGRVGRPCARAAHGQARGRERRAGAFHGTRGGRRGPDTRQCLSIAARAPHAEVGRLTLLMRRSRAGAAASDTPSYLCLAAVKREHPCPRRRTSTGLATAILSRRLCPVFSPCRQPVASCPCAIPTQLLDHRDF